MWVINPSGNSYDNHIEPIFLYGENLERPETFECWQCYQPPAYYVIASAVYYVASNLSSDSTMIWKLVQLINPFMSIGILIFFFYFFNNLKLKHNQKLLLLSFVSFLPRELFTSSVISNDYLLVFASVFACFFFLKFTDSQLDEKRSKINFLLMCIFVILGSLTKQHGMLLIGLPIYTLIHSVIFLKKAQLRFILPITIIVVLLSLSEEAFKYSKTGHLIVSNQDHYNYAENQFPGALKKVEFHTFRIFSLMNDPYLSEITAASFPTEIFARTFFDYEWRYLNPNNKYTLTLGKFGYFIGVIWLVYFSWLLVLMVKQITSFKDLFSANRSRYIALGLLSFCFLLVPVFQTIRYPYFSSMKSMFLLPGILIMVMVFSRILKDLKINRSFSYTVATFNAIYSIVLVITIFLILSDSLEILSGPIWPLLSRI